MPLLAVEVAAYLQGWHLQMPEMPEEFSPKDGLVPSTGSSPPPTLAGCASSASAASGSSSGASSPCLSPLTRTTSGTSGVAPTISSWFSCRSPCEQRRTCAPQVPAIHELQGAKCRLLPPPCRLVSPCL